MCLNITCSYPHICCDDKCQQFGNANWAPPARGTFWHRDWESEESPGLISMKLCKPKCPFCYAAYWFFCPTFQMAHWHFSFKIHTNSSLPLALLERRQKMRQCPTTKTPKARQKLVLIGSSKLRMKLPSPVPSTHASPQSGHQQRTATRLSPLIPWVWLERCPVAMVTPACSSVLAQCELSKEGVLPDTHQVQYSTQRDPSTRKALKDSLNKSKLHQTHSKGLPPTAAIGTKCLWDRKQT